MKIEISNPGKWYNSITLKIALLAFGIVLTDLRKDQGDHRRKKGNAEKYRQKYPTTGMVMPYRLHSQHSPWFSGRPAKQSHRSAHSAGRMIIEGEILPRSAQEHIPVRSIRCQPKDQRKFYGTFGIRFAGS